MLTDRFSNLLIQSSQPKPDHTHFPNYQIRYDMNRYQGGVGLGILAAGVDRCVTGSDCLVVSKCVKNGDQMMIKKKKEKKGCCCVFSLRVEDDDLEAFNDVEFLIFCDLCGTELSGKDIYMYRGERAFCSEECREVQIAKDERNEDFKYFGVSKSVVVGANSSPPSHRDQMMSTGIFSSYFRASIFRNVC